MNYLAESGFHPNELSFQLLVYSHGLRTRSGPVGQASRFHMLSFSSVSACSWLRKGTHHCMGEHMAPISTFLSSISFPFLHPSAVVIAGIFEQFRFHQQIKFWGGSFLQFYHGLYF